ncbi:MAG TPA: DUF885 family protein [Gemmatimonadales bacterium]|nr:DUF885 family protein [Gemmatimonadales bacterium]
MSAVEELCRSYLDARWHFDPSAASAAGVAAHDGRLGRFDEPAVRELLATLRSLAGAAEELDVEDQQEEIDRTALLDEMRVALFRFQHEQPHRRNPAFWLRHLLDGLYAVAERPDPTEDTVAALTARLADVPAYLGAAESTLKEPPRVHADAALGMLGGGAELLVALLRRFGPVAPAAAPALEAATRDALAALRGFGEAVADKIALSTDPHTFAVGEEQFNRRLRHEHALLAGAPELWRYGLHLRDEVEAELEQVARRIDRSRHWRDLVEHLREEEAPEADAVEDLYATELARAHRFSVEHALVSDGSAPLGVGATPDWLRTLVPVAGYRAAPSHAPAQGAWLLVTLPPAALGGEARRRMLREHAAPAVPSLVAHEGWPGRHAHASGRARLSLVRRTIGTPLTAEGWGLYALDVLQEAGFDRRPEERLFRLLRLLRAAVRVDLDIGLHTRGMTAEEAVEELVRRLPMERRTAQGEVLRCCQSPTYGLCEAVGRRDLLSLREAYRVREGAAGALRAFHDEVLTYGALPVSLIRWGMGLDG